MPLTASGNRVMNAMAKEYGSKKAKSIFYASINKGVKGSDKWHRTKVSGKARLAAMK